MQLIRDSSRKLAHSVVTIGNFDGVHLGHQKLIHQLIKDARALKTPSVFFTFEPSPTEFFTPHNPAARLMRFSEKWEIVKTFDIDYFYCARFDAALAKLPAEDFVKIFLVDQLHAKKIIVGDDFQFGAKRTGDIELLKKLAKKYDFDVEAILQKSVGDARVSSTRIRNAVLKGDFEAVREFTGRAFTLAGKVVYGNQIGRTLGFPTANIHLHRKRVPLMGIFVVRVYGLCDYALPGVASVGYRPTFNGKQIILEVFLFDFNKMIYGKKITVEFLKKIRDEVKFDSIDDLVVQMKDDARIAKAFFAK